MTVFVRSFAGVLGVVACLTMNATAQADEASQRAMLANWAGSYNTQGFLNEMTVRPALQKLLGAELDHLFHNLNVRAAVDLSGETLSVNGNAPHQGTEEEAIVCVTVLPLKTVVEAAILSKGAITIYSHEKQYENASVCIKDWITLANSHHMDRIKQPANVRVVEPWR